MQSAKHLAALGFLGAFGIFIAAGSKKPAQRFDVGSLPPVDRYEIAYAGTRGDSPTDECVRAHAANPNNIDSASYRALREACLRAAEDQAKDLAFRDDDWEVVHPGTNASDSNHAKSTRTPRVARRTPAAPNDDSTARNR